MKYRCRQCGKSKETFVPYEKAFDRTFYAKKEIQNFEVEAAVEARKRRLESEGRA